MSKRLYQTDSISVLRADIDILMKFVVDLLANC